MGFKRFTDIRAWQACREYKLAVYRLCLDPPFARDWERRKQLEESVAGPPAHITEGFGRFNHATDKGYITEAVRAELDALAVVALQEITGLMEYLQSPEALRNARRAREKRIASRQERLGSRPPRS